MDIASIYDNFNDNSIGALWAQSYASATTIDEVGGKAVVTIANGVGGGQYAAFRTAASYDLTDRYCAVRIDQMVTADPAGDVFMQAATDLTGANRVEFLQEDGNLYFRHILAGVATNLDSVTFDIAEHKYWRFRESGGTLYWETSADGVFWIIQFSEANPITLTSLSISLGAGCWQSVSLAVQAVHFELFNLLPVSSLKDNFNDNTEDTDKWGRAYNSSATRAETGGELVLTPAVETSGINYTGYISTNFFDLSESRFFARCTQTVNEETVAANFIQVAYLNDTYGLEVIFENGRLLMRHNISGVRTTLANVEYDPKIHRYWGIRGSGGVVYWETSKDGINWDVQYEEADPFDVSGVLLSLGAGSWKAETNPESAKFDNVNLLPVSEFKDSFNDNNISTLKWTEFEAGSALITEQNRRLEVDFPASSTSSTDGDLTSVPRLDLSESSGIIEVIEMPNAATNALGIFRIYTDNDNYFQWLYEAGTLYAQRRKAAVTDTITSFSFSATDHRWLKIAESGGTVTWYTSLDGKTWTSKGTYSHGMDINYMKILIGGICYQNETNAGFFITDNLNQGEAEIRATDLPLIVGHQYRLGFSARVAADHNIAVIVTNQDEDNHSLNTDFEAKAGGLKRYKYTFTAVETDDHSTLLLKPDIDAIETIYIDNFELIDLTMEQKSHRLVRIQGSMRAGSFVQTLTLREITASETA